jgi:hypothetical protein
MAGKEVGITVAIVSALGQSSRPFVRGTIGSTQGLDQWVDTRAKASSL